MKGFSTQLLVWFLIYALVSLITTYSKTDRIVFLDVDEGDGIYISIGDREIMIDGGTNSSVYEKLAEYRIPTRSSFDIYIVTHWHTDHYIGMDGVISSRKYKEIYYSNTCIPTEYDLGSRGASTIAMEIGNSRLYIFYPNEAKECQRGNSAGFAQINNSSLIVVLTTEEQAFVLLGDIHKNREHEIVYGLKNVVGSREVILKAGHHCSDTSTSGELLEVLQPTVVICTAGLENRHGHPDPSVISRIVEAGSTVLITGEGGSITFTLE